MRAGVVGKSSVFACCLVAVCDVTVGPCGLCRKAVSCWAGTACCGWVGVVVVIVGSAV